MLEGEGANKLYSTHSLVKSEPINSKAKHTKTLINMDFLILISGMGQVESSYSWQ